MVKSMFLVHARFEILKCLEVSPAIRQLARAALVLDDQVEHVAVHLVPPRHFVLGFYLLSDSLAQAEATAEEISRRLLDDTRIPPAELLDVGVPLIAPLLRQ